MPKHSESCIFISKYSQGSSQSLCIPTVLHLLGCCQAPLRTYRLRSAYAMASGSHQETEGHRPPSATSRRHWYTCFRRRSSASEREKIWLKLVQELHLGSPYQSEKGKINTFRSHRFLYKMLKQTGGAVHIQRILQIVSVRKMALVMIFVCGQSSFNCSWKTKDEALKNKHKLKTIDLKEVTAVHWITLPAWVRERARMCGTESVAVCLINTKSLCLRALTRAICGCSAKNVWKWLIKEP